jgi:serine/threonine protein kinase/tetratricopeptide (TPR) repeat protein
MMSVQREQSIDIGLDASLADSFLAAVARPLTPVPFPGERLGGWQGQRYEVRQVLGQGGMGAVFRAFDHELQRTVALKFLLPSYGGPKAQPLLFEEAKAIARLDHENIVRIHDVAQWDVEDLPGEEPLPRGIPFLVMEYLEGESLRALLRRQRPRLKQTLAIALDVAAGLAHAHERHLVHRDIKPGNIFLLTNGRAKLLDFGLARPAAHDLAHSGLEMAGTPAYMSPEQWRGEPPDVRSDIWALGLLLFELLTGEYPLPLTTREEFRDRVTSAEPMPSVRERHPEIPEELARLIAAALAKAPEKRIANGAELLARLRELQEHLALEPTARTRPGVAQWRQVTMVSCWLSPTEESGDPLDVEDLGELQSLFHRACTRIVHEYGGTVSTCLGAEVLACIGYPVTREDDSERAVLMAMQLAEDLPRDLAAPSRRGLTVKVGVHTDRVVLADVTPELHGTTPAIQGRAPAIASWLASQAAPRCVLLSDRTYALVKNVFQVASQGQRLYTGPLGRLELGLFEVCEARQSMYRFDRALVSGELTPLVGRESELRRLARLCEESLSGRGGLILLRGEAGIGKSRLAQELHGLERLRTYTRCRCQCWPQSQSSAFHPLIEGLQRFFHFLPTDSAEQKRWKLQQRMEEAELPPEDAAPLAAFLLLPVAPDAPFARLAPERQREEGMRALVDLLQRVAARDPFILVLEDVHWADPSTRQFLDLLLEHIGGTRVCVLCTARPEFEHGWAGHPSFHELELERLSTEHTEALVWEVTRGRALPEQTLKQLTDRTDGIPLFVEELTRTVLEQGAAARSSDGADRPGIPATLHELLLARLDQLPPQQRALVQLAAILGRDFSYALLRAVSSLEESRLQRELAQLEQARVLSRHGWPPEATYSFKHALIQNAASQTLIRSMRQRYHGRVVQVLMEQFPQLSESQPELLAQHYTGAGRLEEAVGLWQRAGELAAARSAFVEAIHHFGTALEQLARLPHSRERDQREVVIRASLGLTLVPLKGYTATEVEEVFLRALELCERLGGDVPMSVLWGLWGIAHQRDRVEDVERILATHRHLLERSDEPLVQLQSHHALASHYYWRGEYDTAWWHSQQSMEHVAQCGPAALLHQGSEAERRHLTEVVLCTYVYHGSLALMRNDKRLAHEVFEEATVLAESTGHPFFICLVLLFNAIVPCELGQLELARERTDRLRALSIENKFLFFLAVGDCVLGAINARLGNAQVGIEQLRKGLGLFQAMGTALTSTYYMRHLAQACLLGGRIEEGLAVVREGLALADRGMLGKCIPELTRVQGELLLQRGELEAARSCFERALALALRGGGVFYGLRAKANLDTLAPHADWTYAAAEHAAN